MLRLLKSSPRLTAWAIVNVTGMGLYLLLASRLWPVKGEENTPGGPGDAFYYIFILVPILLFFAAINMAELYRIVRHGSEKRIAVFIWTTVLCLWIAIFLVGHIQGVRNISADFS
jgi:uncharacterized membrane protein YozB (DUF420 family)